MAKEQANPLRAQIVEMEGTLSALSSEIEGLEEKADSIHGQIRAKRKDLNAKRRALLPLKKSYNTFFPGDAFPVPVPGKDKVGGVTGKAARDLVLSVVRKASPAKGIDAAGVLEVLKDMGSPAAPKVIGQALGKLSREGLIVDAGDKHFKPASAAAALPSASGPKSIERYPHKLETLQRVPKGFECPRCGATKPNKIDFLSIDCRR